mmetsp:Transcript_31446/g.57112  ORF Transcript_31446/g.57112 Transcript_31446/m.57112 type:complete len:158 (+) Transcript_31446:116-589(+)
MTVVTLTISIPLPYPTETTHAAVAVGQTERTTKHKEASVSNPMMRQQQSCKMGSGISLIAMIQPAWLKTFADRHVLFPAIHTPLVNRAAGIQIWDRYDKVPEMNPVPITYFDSEGLKKTLSPEREMMAPMTVEARSGFRDTAISTFSQGGMSFWGGG